MSALITGATGFAGQWLVRRLLQTGQTVWGASRSLSPGVGTDDSRTSDPPVPVSLGPYSILHDDEIRTVRWQRYSTDEPESWHGLVARTCPRTIYHLAGLSSPHDSYRDPAATFRANVLGTIHLLQAVGSYIEAGHEPPRILLIGSGQMYGQVPLQDLPLAEVHPLDPINPYSVSKAAQELVGRQYWHALGWPIIMTRSFNQIGPGQQEGFSVSDFALALARIRLGVAEPVLLVGNLSAQRDFTDVRDAVEAYRLLVEAGRPGQVYNVCSGRMESMEAILHRLIELSGIRVDIRVDRQRLRPVDEPVLQGSAAKLRRETGWAPRIPLEQTLADLVEFCYQQVQKNFVPTGPAS